VPLDRYLRYRGSFCRTPEALVHQRVTLHDDPDCVWFCHRGQEVARYPRSYEPGSWSPAPRLRPEPPPAAAPARISVPQVAPPELSDTRRSARERKAKQAPVGERLPYLLGKLKAPRVLERLGQTATRARQRSGPTSSSSRRCSSRGVRARRLGSAPARPPRRLSSAEDARGLRLTGPTGGRAAARDAPGPLAWIDEHANV
jgi:hypothetical protein